MPNGLRFIPSEQVKIVERVDIRMPGRPIEEIYKPVIPTGDICCSGVCRELNTTISKLTQTLRFRETELRTLPRGKIRSQTKRGIDSLLSQLTSLKDHRLIMKDKNICGCIEKKKPEELYLPQIEKIEESALVRLQ